MIASPGTEFMLMGNFFLSQGKQGKVRNHQVICSRWFYWLLFKYKCYSDTIWIHFSCVLYLLQVIEVKASKRTGPQNMMVCLRETLKNHYGEKPVGLGGGFIVEKGKAKIHVMVNCCEKQQVLGKKLFSICMRLHKLFNNVIAFLFLYNCK